MSGTRLTHSDIIALLLTKPSRDSESIDLSRNARGETQISLTVRTQEGETLVEAAARARELYDTLRASYPLADGHVGATVPPKQAGRGRTV